MKFFYDNNLKDTHKKLIMNIIPFGELLFFKKSIAFEVIKHAFGIQTKVMIDSIPENARPRAILISRIYFGIWLSIIIWSLLISSFGYQCYIFYCLIIMEKVYINLLLLHNMLV